MDKYKVIYMQKGTIMETVVEADTYIVVNGGHIAFISGDVPMLTVGARFLVSIETLFVADVDADEPAAETLVVTSASDPSSTGSSAPEINETPYLDTSGEAPEKPEA